MVTVRVLRVLAQADAIVDVNGTYNGTKASGWCVKLMGTPGDALGLVQHYFPLIGGGEVAGWRVAHGAGGRGERGEVVCVG